MGDIRVGVCSWTDTTLIRESDFYPPGVNSAETRLRHYGSQFSLVEADAGFYYMPSEVTSIKWAERTPPGFVFDVKANRAFTLHPIEPGKLPKDVAHELPPEQLAKRRLYWPDLPAELQNELLERFRQAQRPLHFARKLGAILVQLPNWIFPSHQVRAHLARLKEAWPDYHLAVEFRDSSWVSARNLDRTLSFLKDHLLTYVCVDEPRLDRTLPPLIAVTNPTLAIVRFHGRNAETWNARLDSAAERFNYLYSKAELEEWLPRLRSLAAEAQSTHALMNNCHQDKGIRNARDLAALLAATPSPTTEAS